MTFRSGTTEPPATLDLNTSDRMLDPELDGGTIIPNPSSNFKNEEWFVALEGVEFSPTIPMPLGSVRFPASL